MIEGMKFTFHRMKVSSCDMLGSNCMQTIYTTCIYYDRASSNTKTTAYGCNV